MQARIREMQARGSEMQARNKGPNKQKERCKREGGGADGIKGDARERCKRVEGWCKRDEG
jgi:hypothetical protein